MAAKIVHFGADSTLRIEVLKRAGYSVVACDSIGQLHAALLILPEASAVAVTENRADLSPQLVSLVRSVSGVPLILFQGSDPYYEESEFDLVIPSLATPDNWLKEIRALIARPSQRES